MGMLEGRTRGRNIWMRKGAYLEQGGSETILTSRYPVQHVVQLNANPRAEIICKKLSTGRRQFSEWTLLLES